MPRKYYLPAILLTIVALLFLPSCNNSTTEHADIHTTLSINDSFSGSRTIVLTFPESIVSTGTETEANLDKVIQKYCPESMNYVKNITDGKINYSFLLQFESAENYKELTTQLVGKQTTVSFSHPDTVMTTGWKLEENFESGDLLQWINEGARTEGFSDISFTIEETSTQVALNSDVKTSDPKISINCLDGYPIQKITINTVNQKNSYDRTIVFTIAQSTYDSVSEKSSDSHSESIKDYFSRLTDKTANASWLLENNAYNYTVKFNDVTLKELHGYTNRLFDTIYGDISYADKSTGSTALAEQNSFTESIDLSHFISNGATNVPLEYTYSVDGSTELGECQIFQNDEWIAATDLLDTNRYGKVAAIRSSDSFIMLRINDGKQYTASSIDITATPLDANKLQKSITFKYDIATGGNEASDYTTSYFDKLNKGAVQSVEGGKNTCTVTFSGTPEEINSQISSIFGSHNLIKFSSETQFMSLRTKKQFTDHVDFSTLIVGKNIDTPVNYIITTQSGDIIKSFRLSYQDTETQKTVTVDSDLKKDENGFLNMTLSSSDLDVEFSVTSPNISDIIFCSFVSALIILITIALIFVFRSRKLPVTGLGAGHTDSGLPGGNKLAVTNKKTKPVPKNERKQ